MLRLLFLPLSLIAMLALSCEKEIIDKIAPTVIFEHLDGSPINQNVIDLNLGEEAEFTILIEDEANIRDIRILMSVNDAPSEPIIHPDYLDTVESDINRKIMAADIPFSASDYAIGDRIKVTVSVNDPYGNVTVKSLTINVVG